jgi:phosphate starvation-inducible PhoH-like protein
LNTRKRYYNFDLAPVDNRRLASLCGQFDEHLRQVERQLSVEIHNRGHHFQIKGAPADAKTAVQVINTLYAETEQKEPLIPATVHLFLHEGKINHASPQAIKNGAGGAVINCRHAVITPHSPNQQLYVKNILSHDINFGVGPAGTGKTYLAVACAVAAMEQEQVSRILLVRPAVEAGEKLGFLPGDFTQKIDPYFRPLYDALYEMLSFETVMKLIEQHTIEIAPLAYMRGRTLNDAFIILDEGQNTTKEQMKMFLTRIGFNSKVVVTGDITQTDLPKGSPSGLRHCLEVLKDTTGISFTHFQAGDVVRHPLVQSILTAYEQYEAKEK